MAFPSPSGNSTPGFGCGAGTELAWALSWAAGSFCAKLFDGTGETTTPKINTDEIKNITRGEKSKIDRRTIPASGFPGKYKSAFHFNGPLGALTINKYACNFHMNSGNNQAASQMVRIEENVSQA
jgi:hypothetical protein